MAAPHVETPPTRPRVPPLEGGLSASSVVELRTGREMPVIGLGTWMLTSHTPESVQHAFELGYRLVDTSFDYRTQPGVGKAVRRSIEPRESLYIVMKVEPEENGYDATRRNLEEMRLAYADLVLIHRPPDKGVGEKLWEQLIRAREDRLVRDIGVCSYKVEQLEALSKTGEVPAVQQLEWSPFGHSLDMLNYCRGKEIVLQAYSPLTRTKRLGDERLVAIARRHRKSPAQVILRWNVQHGVVPIPKAYREDHQRDNLNIFDFSLDEADMGQLDALNKHYSALGELGYL